MKRVLFTMTLGLAAFYSNAQAVFNVKSPAGIAGNYDFTWADPASAWGPPILMSQVPLLKILVCLLMMVHLV